MTDILSSVWLSGYTTWQACTYVSFSLFAAVFFQQLLSFRLVLLIAHRFFRGRPSRFRIYNLLPGLQAIVHALIDSLFADTTHRQAASQQEQRHDDFPTYVFSRDLQQHIKISSYSLKWPMTVMISKQEFAIHLFFTSVLHLLQVPPGRLILFGKRFERSITKDSIRFRCSVKESLIPLSKVMGSTKPPLERNPELPQSWQ